MKNKECTHIYKHSKWAICLLLVLVSSHFSFTANAGDTNWHPLFGKNLSRADYNEDVWFLKGNILHAGPYECIWSLNEYNSFELDLEFQNEAGASSYLLICCSDPGNWINNSVQIALNDVSAVTDINPGEIVCGSVKGYPFPVKEGVLKKAGEWNHLRVKYAGGRVSVILNGRKVTDGEINTPEEVRGPGFIGLEGYRTEAPVIYRNIRIRSVKDPESGSPSNKREGKTGSRIFPQY
ncbi:MAG: DUF1080 domain-containing protein [Tannerellaceae bacterium]|nr:DUF1080 domain-containing protein [Tannerellaceae bacterium]